MIFKGLFRRFKNTVQPGKTLYCETAGNVCFEIDGRRYWWPRDTHVTTEALRWLAGVSQDRDVFWEAPGLGADRLISEVYGVTPVSGDRFFTVSRLINAG